jgi:GNAT superfamily N-acetyltransferase
VSHKKGGASGIRIRPVEERDKAGWRQLWNSYCDFYAVDISPHVTEALWERIMDRSGAIHAMVAESSSDVRGKIELIGFANFVLHPYTWGTDLVCYLEDLFVAEHSRGLGAGSALIEALIRLAKESGWSRLYWHTHEDNELARSLYDKFTPVDPFVRYVVRTR